MMYLIFILSMSALIYGANHIITQSEKIALRFGISHFTIGATLIAIGTSLPEMAASVTASIQDKSDMAIANVLGSNIFNISLILGLVFLLSKNIISKRDIFQKDTAWSLIPLFLFIIMVYDGQISRLDGTLFLITMLAYLYFLAKDEKKIAEEIDESLKENFSAPQAIFFLILGFILVIVGANFTIDSASQIAQSIGVSEWVIALLLIAFGTSLPELIVSIVAARKGNTDMIIGNIIGSNIANLCVVLGLAAVAKPLSFSFVKSGFDLMCVAFCTLLLVFITANKLYDKSSGIALLSITILVVSNSLKIFG